MKKTALCFLFLVCTCLIYAGDTTSLVFLKNPVGARPVGMGEAFAGLSNDINGIFYNPASISFISNYSLSFSHIEFVQGIRYELLSGLIPIDAGSSGAISIIYINNGVQERRDIFGTVNGEFTPYQIVPVLTFAKNITASFSLGANVKLPYETIDTYSSMKVVFDIAGFYKTDKNYSFGLNLQNIGVYDNLPVNLKLGAAYQNNIIQAGFDVNIPYRSNVSFNLGAEVKILENCFLRGGLRYKTGDIFNFINNVTLGLGVKFDIITFDYGFKIYDELGNTHFVSLIVNIK